MGGRRRGCRGRRGVHCCEWKEMEEMLGDEDLYAGMRGLLYLRIYAFARKYSSRSSGACKSCESIQLSSDAE